MASFFISSSRLSGELSILPSKSQTIRAILFAMMARGKSRVRRFLQTADCSMAVDAARLFGAKISVEGNDLIIDGVGGVLQPADDVIQCGNSGLVLRFFGALASLAPTYTVFTGDGSIRSNRVVQPLLDGIEQLGGWAVSTRLNGTAPFAVRGPLRGGFAAIAGEDSQPISGLLIAGAFAGGAVELEVKNPGEKPWVELTLDWFNRLGIVYEREGFERYRLQGQSSIESFDYRVPADFSTAAFPLAAAIVTESELELRGLNFADPQGDRILFPLLQKMGAMIEIGEKVAVRQKKLIGMRIDVNDCIDALPILAVLGCFAEGETALINGAVARKKESNRISAMAVELKKMGADIEETIDGLVVRKSKLKGARLESYGDHRIALALSIAALGAEGASLIEGVECAAKTYPTFLADFQKIGAAIEVRA